MANEVNYIGGWLQGVDGMITGALWVTLVAVVIGGLFLFLWYKKYNKVVIVRKLVHGRKKIMMDKVRYLKDKDDNEYYKFLKLRKLVKLPPVEAIELTGKGAEFLECYLLETGEISWIVDKNDTINSFDPFTTEDRQFLMNQYRKAKLEGGVNWKELILPVFGIVALVIITVSLMIFYKDMGEPLLEMADKISANNQINAQILSKMEFLLNNTQLMWINQTSMQPIKNGVIVPP